MITKSDWHAANQALMADDRRRIDPPTDEEMLAYTRGELTAEEEARVQERLSCYPELVRTLTEPFPMEGAEPGDADYLSDDEFAAHWTAMQKRMKGAARRDNGRVLQFWRWSAAMAAALALVFGSLLWQERSRHARPEVWADQIILPDGRRGATETPVLPARGPNIVLIAWLANGGDYEQHEIEIVDYERKTTVWRTALAMNDDNDYLTVAVPREFLAPGKYQMQVYGRNAAAREVIETYTFEVARK